MSDPDSNFEIKDGVVQPDANTVYNLVVDENGKVVMVPAN